MGQGRHKAENITRRQAEVMQEISRFFSIYGKMPTMQQLANTFGIAAPSIYDILQELVSKGYLKRIEKGSTKPYVINKTVEPEALVTVQIPLLGEIPGGVPVEEFEDQSGDETVAVDKALTTNGAVFALRVDGNSMIGVGIETGDIVIIRHQPIAAGEFTLRGIPSPDLRTMTGALISGKLSSLNSLTISVESKDRMIKTVNIKPITQEILNDAREFLILWEQAALIWNKEHKDTKEQMVSIREKGGLSFPVSEGNRIFLNVVVNGKEKSHGKAINH